MNEQILEDTKDILELVDDKKEKVTNAKQRLKQEKANNENLILATEELKTLHTLKIAGLAKNEYFIDKKKSSIVKFVNEAREMYSTCQELHSRSTNQGNMIDEAFNGLTKTEAKFAQAKSKADELLKSLEEEYENICHEEAKKKGNLKNEAIITEEQKIHDLLANIQKIELEGNDLEMEYRTLQLMVGQNLTKHEAIEAKLFAKREKNNEINAEVKAVEECCGADGKIIEKLEVEITGLEAKMTKMQTEISNLNEYISLLSEEPQEDLDELIISKQQSLNAIRKTKSEKKQKYNELYETNQTALKLAQQECSNFEAIISEFKQKIEISEKHFAELKTEEERLMTDNELSLAALRKHEQEIKYEKQRLKKLMKGEELRPVFTKPDIPKPTPISRPDSVVASSKKNLSNWDSDGSMDADYNAFIQKSRTLKRLKK